jgi:molybdenum cofactor cytidylyltransferase
VLAAGAGRRFGANKLLALLRHRPVIYRSLQTTLNAPLDPVVLVLGCEYEKILTVIEEFRDHPKLHIVRNSHWEMGRAGSLQRALKAVPQGAPGAVVLLGDMPLMTSQLIARVVTAFLETKKLCFPVYEGSAGRPVALPRELFGEFERLRGDQSGLEILERHWKSATKLDLWPTEEATQCDLDTLEDLTRMLKHPS